MELKPMDFQEATAKRVIELFTKEKQNRVLIADEVGLGKTIIASTVVRKYADIVLKDKSRKEPFRVVYICSNGNIANQNARKLGIKDEDCLNISESRLSMQHYNIYSKKMDTSAEQLIPMTPATSFTLKGKQGTKEERALITAVLTYYYETESRKKIRIKKVMSNNVTNWERLVNDKKDEIKDCNNKTKTYLQDMMDSIDNYIKSNPLVNDKLNAVFQEERINWNRQKDVYLDLIVELRKMFASISLSLLNPDLVIMDEFQRFKDLLNTDSNAIDMSSEQSMLNHEFLYSDNTKVLMLSATPYKPYCTYEEIAQNQEQSHYEEFKKVIDFLLGDKEKCEAFKIVWEEYSHHLFELQTDNFSMLLVSKKHAEEKMYECMCRTERRNDNIFDDSKACEVSEISDGDIQSYLEIQRMAEDAKAGSLLLDYAKSAPYLMSFMTYKIRRDIDKQLGHRIEEPSLKEATISFLKRSQISNYEKIPMNNARLTCLQDEVFDKRKNGAELMLWIPASRPYYHTKSVFDKNKGYSKTIVFSGWEMVPRVIAAMTSYEAERLTINRLQNKKERKYFAAEDGEDNKRKKSRVIRLKEKSEELITYPCIYLAELFDPLENIDYDIKIIKKKISSQIKEKIESILGNRPRGKRSHSASQIVALLHALDGKKDYDIDGIPNDAIELLTNLAIGGPAECAYRIFKDCESYKRIDFSREVAKMFVSLFNKPEALDIIDAIYCNKCNEDTEVYYKNVIKYCVDGNLQAVLDEYAFMLGTKGEFLKNDIMNGITKTSSIKVDTRENYFSANRKPSYLRTHFAVGYYNAKISDEAVQRTENIRKAFNSPFRPFVLATTSIGQEGLDFHMYARKVVHWNLPSNPIDIEQREGRINRYMCHAIRQNLADTEVGFGNGPYKENVWNEIMERAATSLKGKHSDLVPYWCLPEDFNFKYKIERIVPMYPYSKDIIKYRHLINVLSIYRLSLGQPKQEELLETISKKSFNKEKLQELYMNLSPWEREKNEKS